MSENAGAGSLRKKRMEEQKRLAEARKAEEQLKTTLRAVLEEDAYQRMMNVKLANPQLFLAAAQSVLSLHRQLGRKVGDRELLLVLSRIKEQTEKRSVIRFERK